MIRQAKVDDIESINKLLYQVHDVHANIRPDLFVKGKKKYNNNELISIINDCLRPIFVYEENNIILGYAFCIFEEEHLPSMQNIKTLYIDDLCVDKEARGKHIGSKLYEYVKKYAKENSCYNITLNVWEGNNNAYEFYKKIGLKVQKTKLEEIL